VFCCTVVCSAVGDGGGAPAGGGPPALWGLRAVPELAEEFAERVDATVGLVGRFLLTPLPSAC
ncbi:hypothetical protein ACWEWX_28880, partial [Streptomyces asiaticus]